MKFWLINVTGLNFGKFFHHEKGQISSKCGILL